jgi:hypothetical protein
VDNRELVVIAELGGSSRSVVERVALDGSTAVVKRFTGEAGGFPREVAALAVLPPSAPVPRLLSVLSDPPGLVMSDEGDGPSLADLLLGSSASAAREGLLSWASAVARLHDESVGVGEAFRAELAVRCDQPASTLNDDLDQTISSLTGFAGELGVSVPDGAWEELGELCERLSGGPAVLSPDDTCPDNNVLTPDGCVLLDFENAQWRHPAWDVAYLTVPWPTCWCSWGLPDEVAEQAVDRYQAACGSPWAASPSFRDDVQAASTVWALMTSAMFMRSALGDDPPHRMPMPPRRALILDRLRAASALSSIAGPLRAALVDRWGSVPLPPAPAFS